MRAGGPVIPEPEVPEYVRVLIWNRQGVSHRVGVTLADERRGSGDGKSFNEALQTAIFNAQLARPAYRVSL